MSCCHYISSNDDGDGGGYDYGGYDYGGYNGGGDAYSRPAYCSNLVASKERGQNRYPKKIEWSLYSVKKCLTDAIWSLEVSY